MAVWSLPRGFESLNIIRGSEEASISMTLYKEVLTFEKASRIFRRARSGAFVICQMSLSLHHKERRWHSIIGDGGNADCHYRPSSNCQVDCSGERLIEMANPALSECA